MTIQVVITKMKNIIVEARTDIFNHPYIQALDVWELEKGGVKKQEEGENCECI